MFAIVVVFSLFLHISPRQKQAWKTSTSTWKNKWHFGLCAIIKWKLCKYMILPVCVCVCCASAGVEITCLLTELSRLETNWPDIMAHHEVLSAALGFMNCWQRLFRQGAWHIWCIWLPRSNFICSNLWLLPVEMRWRELCGNSYSMLPLKILFVRLLLKEA